MAHDGHHAPFPFPIPDPPRVQPGSTPFPPPPLRSPEERINILAHRVGGVPLPLFFAIGAVVGIVLAMTVVSVMRRSTSRRATQARVVSIVSAPVVEHAHALFVWRPATAEERATPAARPVEVEAEAVPVVSPALAARAPARARPVVAMNRPHATQRAKSAASDESKRPLPNDLLSSGL